MPELDAFERSLEAAFRSFAERGVGPVDALEFAERVTRKPATRRWHVTFVPAPRLAWALLAAALLLAALVAVALVGGWRADRRLAEVPPSPAAIVVASQSPTATVNPAEATILATTKAKPLPAQATCPPGSNPDESGRAVQDRPTDPDGSSYVAFDRHAGRIVVLASEMAMWTQPWTYDVCTNAWQRMRVPEVGQLEGSVRFLVYDADSDRTVAFVELLDTPTTPIEVWSYELAADRWTKVRSFEWPQYPERNETYGTAFYHDPSGLVVFYDGATMWAYDVDTDTLTEVPQRPDPAQPAGSGLPDGRITFAYNPWDDLVVAVVVPIVTDDNGEERPMSTVPAETWTFRPGTGSWRMEQSPARSELIVCYGGWQPEGWSPCWDTNGMAVFDEVSGTVVFMTRGWDPPVAPGRVEAYDTRLGAWSTLFFDPGLTGEVREATWCESMPPVYDPLNGRIVCLGKRRDSDVTGVSAFSTATGQWRWLLDRPPAAPAPE